MNQSKPKGWTTTQNLILFFVILFILNTVGFIGFTSLEKKFDQKIVALNTSFSDRTQLLESVQTQLGYGHFIHNFKNLVIRGESDYRSESYSAALLKNAEHLNNALNRYKQFTPLHATEKEAIAEIESLVNQYVTMSKKVIELRNAGIDIKSIDKQVLVDDRNAMQALNQWYDYLNQDWKKQTSILLEESSSQKQLGVILVFLAIFIATFIAFEWLIRRSLISPLKSIHEELSQVCSPECRLDKNRRFNPSKGSLEVRKLSNYLNTMLERIHKQFNELCSIRTTVDQSTSNIMLADNDLNITYMNKSILKTLKLVEKDIQKMLPHFEANNLIGKNIDIFHVHPEHQRQLLGQLKETYVAKLTLGELHLNIIVNPIWGEDGSRIG